MRALLENWVNLAYLAGSALVVIAALLAIFSHRRSEEKRTRFTKLQLDAEKRVADANKRTAAADEAAASAARALEQLREENLALSVELEHEKRLRLEMEERVLRQRQEPPPRILTAGQEEQAVRILREFAGTPVSMIEIEDPEAGPLACQIARIVRNAELQVAVSQYGALVPEQYGII